MQKAKTKLIFFILAIVLFISINQVSICEQIKRNVLIESFCADLDDNGNIINEYLEKMAESFGFEIVLLEYYLWDNKPELYNVSDQQKIIKRYQWYSPEYKASDIPDILFNGLNHRISNKVGDNEKFHKECLNAFCSERRKITDIKLLEGSARIDAEKREIDMDVAVCNYGEFAIPRLLVSFVIYENLEGITKDKTHCYVVRDLVTEDPFKAKGKESCYLIRSQSTIPSHVNLDNIGVVVIAQDMDSPTKEVLQVMRIYPQNIDKGQYPRYDVNRDGIIDVLDLILVSKSFDKISIEALDADINQDCIVNVSDLLIIVEHFGEKY